MGRAVVNGKRIESSSFEKCVNVKNILSVGDEVKYYNGFRKIYEYAEVTSVKGLTVEVDGLYLFTLRKSGEYIEKGFNLQERNRRLIVE